MGGITKTIPTFDFGQLGIQVYKSTFLFMATQDEGITLGVDPGGKPKLALQYLRSYEHLGTAEVTIHSPYVWHCKQLGGQGSGKRATWRRSLGEPAGFTRWDPHLR